MVDEIVIGFDARQAGEHDPRWDDQRRERELLRRDVARPLSVDRLAWPTIFAIWYSKQNRQWARSLPAEERTRFRIGTLPTEERERLGVGTIPVPDWGVTVPHAPLWSNLDRMRGYLDKRASTPPTGCWSQSGGCLASASRTTPEPCAGFGSPLP